MHDRCDIYTYSGKKCILILNNTNGMTFPFSNEIPIFGKGKYCFLKSYLKNIERYIPFCFISNFYRYFFLFLSLTEALPEPPNPCDVNPCEYGSTCHNEDSNGFTCICPPDFVGDLCQFSEYILYYIFLGCLAS